MTRRRFVLLPLLAGLWALLPGTSVADGMGGVRFRVRLPGPLAAKPAIHPDGRILVATARGVQLLDHEGFVLASADDVKLPMQPGFAGTDPWYRSPAGWKVLGGTDACDVDAESFAVREDRPLFAAKGRFVTCAPTGPVELAKRRGEAGAIVRFGDGWLVHDLYYVDVYDTAFKLVAARDISRFGVPTAVLPGGRVLVTTVNGRIVQANARLDVVWEGVRASAGLPVPTRSGAVLLLADAGLSLVDPPHVVWSLPVPAGVRAAVALEGGLFAVLARSGHLSFVRDGRPLWTRAVKEPGSALVAHPSGFVLVQDGTSLVAFESPPPERVDPAATLKLSSPAHAVVQGRLVVTGPVVGEGAAPEQASVCAEPSCARAGKRVYRKPCGENCEAVVAAGDVVLASGGKVSWLDGKGAVRKSLKVGEAKAPVSVSAEASGALLVADGKSVAFVTPRGGKAVSTKAPVSWKSGPLLVGGHAVGLDANDRIVKVTRGKAPQEFRVRLDPSAGPSVTPSSFAFGETGCFSVASGRACWTPDRVVPWLDDRPRSVGFGVNYVACASGGLCVVAPDGTEVKLGDVTGRVDAIVAVGDGTQALLVDGREVRVVFPDGSTRWTASDGDATCGGGWLARTSEDRLVARTCGGVVAFETGVRARR